MLKFLGVGKRRRVQDQVPSAIPGHLFRERPEEDGFVVVGETVAEQKEASSLGYHQDQPPTYEFYQRSDNHMMGSGSSAGASPLQNKSDLFNNSSSQYIEVQPRTDPVEPQYTHSNVTVSTHSRNQSGQMTNCHRSDSKNWRSPSVCESPAVDHGADMINAWRDVPFQLSPKYFINPALNMDSLLTNRQLELSDFYYDFSAEKAILGR